MPWLPDPQIQVPPYTRPWLQTTNSGSTLYKAMATDHKFRFHLIQGHGYRSQIQVLPYTRPWLQITNSGSTLYKDMATDHKFRFHLIHGHGYQIHKFRFHLIHSHSYRSQIQVPPYTRPLLPDPQVQVPPYTIYRRPWVTNP